MHTDNISLGAVPAAPTADPRENLLRTWLGFKVIDALQDNGVTFNAGQGVRKACELAREFVAEIGGFCNDSVWNKMEADIDTRANDPCPNETLRFVAANAMILALIARGVDFTAVGGQKNALRLAEEFMSKIGGYHNLRAPS